MRRKPKMANPNPRIKYTLKSPPMHAFNKYGSMTPELNRSLHPTKKELIPQQLTPYNSKPGLKRNISKSNIELSTTSTDTQETLPTHLKVTLSPQQELEKYLHMLTQTKIALLDNEKQIDLETRKMALTGIKIIGKTLTLDEFKTIAQRPLEHYRITVTKKYLEIREKKAYATHSSLVKTHQDEALLSLLQELDTTIQKEAKQLPTKALSESIRNNPLVSKKVTKTEKIIQAHLNNKSTEEKRDALQLLLEKGEKDEKTALKKKEKTKDEVLKSSKHKNDIIYAEEKSQLTYQKETSDGMNKLKNALALTLYTQLPVLSTDPSKRNYLPQNSVTKYSETQKSTTDETTGFHEYDKFEAFMKHIQVHGKKTLGIIRVPGNFSITNGLLDGSIQLTPSTEPSSVASACKVLTKDKGLIPYSTCQQLLNTLYQESKKETLSQAKQIEIIKESLKDLTHNQIKLIRLTTETFNILGNNAKHTNMTPQSLGIAGVSILFSTHLYTSELVEAKTYATLQASTFALLISQTDKILPPFHKYRELLYLPGTLV